MTDLLLELDKYGVVCIVQHETEEELTLLRDCLSKLPQKSRELLHQRDTLKSRVPAQSADALGSRLTRFARRSSDSAALSFCAWIVAKLLARFNDNGRLRT